MIRINKFSKNMNNTNVNKYHICCEKFGYSLMEIIFCLMIVSIILVTAAKLYNSTIRSHYVNETINSLQSVIGACEDYKNDTGDYSGIKTIDDLIQRGLLSENMKKNSFGGSNNVLSEDRKNFIISVDSIPEVQCLSIKELADKKFTTSNISGSCVSEKSLYTYRLIYSAD